MPDVIPHEYEAAVSLKKLKSFPGNPNRGDINAIRSGIGAIGFYGAVLAQKSSKRIIAGHHRIQAAKAEGIESVPVIWLDVDDTTAKAILVGDNQHARLGEWNEDALTSMLQSIVEENPDLLPATAYDEDSLNALLDKGVDTGDSGNEPEVWESIHAKVVESVHTLWLQARDRVEVESGATPHELDAIRNGIALEAIIAEYLAG